MYNYDMYSVDVYANVYNYTHTMVHNYFNSKLKIKLIIIKMLKSCKNHHEKQVHDCTYCHVHVHIMSMDTIVSVLFGNFNVYSNLKN